jgi:hypothetical protein
MELKFILYVHFVHGKFLDSGEFSWIFLNRRNGGKSRACNSIELCWISLKVEMVAGAGFEQVPRSFDFGELIFFVIGFVHSFVHRKRSV